ncbi:hypothetical protein MMA231_01242 [Asticcacaulis sp. MM231]|uniref:hypothetical protein n=1 Tax=Asticcacaulis sp. MM231 TaxID=3157666 RepID=UPI0032D586ED
MASMSLDINLLFYLLSQHRMDSNWDRRVDVKVETIAFYGHHQGISDTQRINLSVSTLPPPSEYWFDANHVAKGQFCPYTRPDVGTD